MTNKIGAIALKSICTSRLIPSTFKFRHNEVIFILWLGRIFGQVGYSARLDIQPYSTEILQYIQPNPI